jgi:hypothetical protein
MEIMDKKARMNNLYNYDSVNDIFDNLFTSLMQLPYYVKVLHPFPLNSKFRTPLKKKNNHLKKSGYLKLHIPTKYAIQAILA